MENNLPDFPGIDNQTGLTMTGGKPEFFIKMLTKFANSYAEAPEEIKKMLASNDMNGAVIKAHSIKGVAGTLGAKGLHALAADVESALKNDPQNLDEDMYGKFAAELSKVIEGIKANIVK